MYDIKIFIESDWTFGWRINTGREVIYWVWKDHDELIRNLKNWLDLAFQEMKLTPKNNFDEAVRSGEIKTKLSFLASQL
ncbi:MAG: hypothetical protein ACD_49C00040G0001 [uncultured bacterium (gcode 4)]|uniref:Uncharacterized protein n=1 Tax=uncultured bacterium (gcode 4) TaxID=1234023 RepID=K2AEH3_9BACT|nr:MAG: hypothetical protein ACD_49C00040G0001 [uncultured bacterium (gcode 4)]